MNSVIRRCRTLLGHGRTINANISTRRNRRRGSCVPCESLEARVLLTAGIGLQAQYFDSADLTGAAVTRTDANIDFDWGSGSPAAAISADTFSVRWSGQVEASVTETHSFFVNADDGARLWVNGQLLVDQFNGGPVADATASIDLISGRRYDIQLEYRENINNAAVKLEWSAPSLAKQVVPTERLFPAARGSLSVERFDTISGSAVSDLVGNISFPDTPISVSTLNSFETVNNAGDTYGRRVAGLIHAPVNGAYRFYVAADESAELWLSNSSNPAGKQKIAEVTSAVASRDWTASAGQQSGEVFLAAGQSYYVEALHKDDTGADHLAVGWTLPGESVIDVIPGELLSPVLHTVRIYSDMPNVSEGSAAPARFTIVRGGAPVNNPLTVNYTVQGEAINGTDFVQLPGTITIPAGAESVTLNITPLTDAIIEGDETAVIELQAGLDYQVGFISERTVHGKVQDDSPAPSGGTSLWTETHLTDFSHFGGTFTTESDANFGNVIQAEISTLPEDQFSAQLRQNTDAPVNAGDVLFVEFYAKSIGGPGEVSAIFEESGGAFTKSLSQGIPISADWSKIQIPFTATESYVAGEAGFGFHLGQQVQTLQFTDFQLLNYGPPQSLAPKTNLELNELNGTWGTAQTVAVDGQPFDVAYQVSTTTVPTQFWHLQALERNDVGVANGDTMRIEFFARAIAGTDPYAGLTMQRTDTFAQLFTQSIDLTSDWQTFSCDIVATDDFAADGLQFVFNLGGGRQTVEIGGLTWKNPDNAVDAEDLPRQFPAASYVGRDGNDLWRASADDRIAADRKGSVVVNVVDANGQPLDGAVANIRQVKHEFKFGSAITAFDDRLNPNGTDESLKYQGEILRLFNTVVPENSIKWPGFLNDRQRGIDAANFAVDNDLYLRGHNAIWPSRTYMPGSIWAEYDSRVISDGAASAEAWLKAQLSARIADVATTFSGLAAEWDVVNEPFSNHDVMDIFGDEIVLEWYQQFRDADPGVKLTLNDYAIFSTNGGNTAHRASFDYWLGLLNDASLLDVIGEQSHYSDANLTDIEVLGELINSYHTQFNTPIAITEFDLESSDEQLQADYLRDYLTMSFSQPAITEFLHWGFWEGAHYAPGAALYREDFSVKPNGQAYEDLIFGSWWSDVRGTSRDGAVAADVFRGDYEIVVEYAGQSYLTTVTVDGSGNSIVTVAVPVNRINLKGVSFNAASDHLANGATDVTFYVENDGDADAAAFATHFVWSPNNIVGDADDVVINDSRHDFPGLAAGASTSRTISVQLDRAVLYQHSTTTTPAGLGIGTISGDVSHLFLVVDVDGGVAEADEADNFGRGELLDGDDVTYFPWDENRDGTAAPLEAIEAIKAIDSNNPAYDFDGDGVVTPLEALSSLQRIGYIRASGVTADTPAVLSGVSAAPAELVLEAAGVPQVLARPILAIAELVSPARIFDVFVDKFVPTDLVLFANSELSVPFADVVDEVEDIIDLFDDFADEVVDVIPDGDVIDDVIGAIDDELSTVGDWLDLF